MNTKKVYEIKFNKKQLEVIKTNIGIERDKMRVIYEDLSSLLDNTNDALEDLENSIERLSEQC